MQQHPRFRVSLRTVLAAVTFVAMSCALLTQHLRLNAAQAALSRYEASLIPTSLGSDQFRIIPRIVIDTDNCKVFTYRIESTGTHTASVSSGGDSNGGSSSYDAKTGLHYSEVTILIDHIKSRNAVKLMPKVGGAQGYAIENVPDEFSLDDAVSLLREHGIYKRNEVVELFRFNERPYTLNLKR